MMRNGHMPGRLRRLGGFTLTELVLVIVLLGILSIVVVPSFNSTPVLARGFHDEVASAARHAQKMAVASGCSVRLEIAANAYALQQRCGGGAWAPVSHPARSGAYAGSAPSGVGLIGSPSSFTFLPNGEATPGSMTVAGRTITILSTGHVSAS